MRLFALLVALTTASFAQAQEWMIAQGVTTASLSAEGWRQASAVPLPAGPVAAVLTYWEGEIEGRPVTVRCITTFDGELQDLRDVCRQPRSTGQ